MALSDHFHKPKPIPLVMSAVSVLLLFGLSAWQFQRLSWKEGLIAELELAQIYILDGLPEDPEKYRFYRVQLQGEYLPEHEFHLAARYFRSKLGYSLLTPFKLTDGRIVIVSRGWVPSEMKEKAPAAPTGEQTLLAQIRTSDERNYFTPMNQPDKNVWFGRDAQQMGESVGLDVLPITLDIVGEQNPEVMPVPADGQIKLRNDHLMYAITWLCIGITALIISLLYHRKKPEVK